MGERKNALKRYPNSRIRDLRAAAAALLLVLAVGAAAAVFSVAWQGERADRLESERLRSRLWSRVVDLLRDIPQLSSPSLSQAAGDGDEARVFALLEGQLRGRHFAVVSPELRLLATSLSGGGEYALTDPMLRSIESLREGSLSVAYDFEPLCGRTGQAMVYAASRLTLDGRETGFLFLSLSREELDSLLDTGGESQAALVNAGRTVWSSGTLADAAADGDEGALPPAGSYVSHDSTVAKECRVVTFRSVLPLRRAAGTALGLVAAVALPLAAVFWVLSVREGRRERRSLCRLRGVMDSASGMELDFRVESDPDDELSPLYDAVNAIMDRVRELVVKNGELAEVRSRMEVKQLQGQFNPHFVFNLLASLRYMIRIDPEKAGDVVSGLSRLLRYSIENGRIDVPLETDIRHMENYLSLQKIRFGDRLDYRLDISPELSDRLLPKLLLQPLVENSIAHNMEKTERLLITLTGERRGDEMVFVVRDNGQGIPPMDLDRLRELLRHPDDKADHIGLLNVHRTIQLRYGERYGLDLHSVYSRGTTITVTLPLTAAASETEEAEHE